MAKLARDVMTSDPACCTVETTLDEVAKLMIQHDCGEIPVVDAAEQVVNLHDSLSHRQLDFSFLIRYTKQPGPNGGMSSRLRWILWERIDGLTL